MLFFYAFTGLINAITSTFLGFLVYSKNRKDKVNQSFALFCLSVAVWSYAYYFWPGAQEKAAVLFWFQVLHIGAIFIPICYLHFVLVWINLYQEKKRVLKLGYLVSFILCFFVFTPLFIKDMVPKFSFQYWAEPGILYHFFLFIFFIYSIYAVYLLLKAYQKSSGVQRTQIRYILLGTITGYLGGMTNYFLWYNIPISPVGNWTTTFYLGLVAYAITKHHFMNIKVIVTELLTFAIWIFVLVRTLLADTLQERLINGGLFLFLVVSGILLIRSVLREVKHREQIEKLAGELEKANVRLRELDQAKSEFVTITSHQLRAPITAIKGYISMLMEGSFGEIPEKAKTVIDKVYQSSDRLVNLINDFLNLSRIERGKMEYDFKEFDLKELVKNIYEDFSQINIKKETPLKFTFDMNEREKYIVKADQGKIRQAIGNLIDNALKYTKQGFVKMSLYKDTMKEKIIFKIQDSGMGIDRDALSRLFQKFSRAERNKLSVHVDGTGLGLYVAKEIMKAHGGDIRAESRGTGKGTEFYVEFPMNFITPQEKNRIEEEQNRRAGNVEEFLKGI